MENTSFNKVLLLDENNGPAGSAPKLEAHIKGLKHRAFSIYIFDSTGNMLLQKRASQKYHSGGLWTNACCSHPVNYPVIEEAEIRLEQEMGITADLREAFTFHYRAEFDNGLIENEVDTVLIGTYDDKDNIKPDPEEVEEIRWISIDELKKEIVEKEDEFTVWFKLSYEKAIEYAIGK